MTSKKHKAAKLSIDKSPSPRKQLDQLNEFIPRNYKFLHQENNNLGLTKSWVRDTTRCNASGDKLRLCPQLYHLDDSPYSSLESTLYTKQFVVASRTRRIFPSIRNPENIPSKLAKVFSHPLSTCLQLSGAASPSLVSYALNESKDGFMWNRCQYTLINYECNVIDPFDANRKCLQFTSIVYLQGVAFALSLHGALAVIQEVGSRITITAISSSRAVPSVSSRFFKEYLVALDGEIFLVFLIHRNSIRDVDQVEVFRLCFPALKWIKVERIQGKTLFLDQYRLEVKLAETDSRRNCICFTHRHSSEYGWWVYDMESGFIASA